MQVLNVTVDKIIKQYIENFEDQWVNDRFDEWKGGKYSVRDRRILSLKWVREA
jgi:hypothetical protein